MLSPVTDASSVKIKSPVFPLLSDVRKGRFVQRLDPFPAFNLLRVVSNPSSPLKSGTVEEFH